jgi:hypothetical protein
MYFGGGGVVDMVPSWNGEMEYENVRFWMEKYEIVCRQDV